MVQEQSLSGKRMLVTGATAGIGYVTALELSRMGAEVLIVSRNPEKCLASAENIRQLTGSSGVDFFVADLSSQAQIRQLVSEIQAKYNRLDGLVNNAGGIFLNRQLSVDGIEMTLALNHLSYFLLTNLLLDLLKESPEARVVNVSSNAHFDHALDFSDLQFEQRYIPLKAYGCSKFANMLFTFELARRLEGSTVTANVLHPGLVNTNIGKNASWWLGWVWKLYMFMAKGLSPEQGAQTSIYLASSPEVKHTTGKYFTKKKMVSPDPATQDPVSAQQLWEMSSQLVGI